MSSSAALKLAWNGSVAIIRLDDPPTLNAVTPEVIEAFVAALDIVERDGRAMVLTGAGKSFCSGANLSGGMDIDLSDEGYDAGLVLETHINPLMMRLRNLAIPWVSAVRGAAAGVGAALALAGDMIIASETAYFLQAFSRIGLVPDGGLSHILVRTIGRPRAMELMLLGQRLPAAMALQWGLINQVVADDTLDARALAIAAQLANGPASLRATRRLAWDAVDEPWPSALAAERALQRAAGQSADHREGVAAFLGKRTAAFVGR